MRGNCKHGAYALDPEGTWEKLEKETEPGVGRANDEDGYYMTIFESWEEIDAFLAELKGEAEKAFGVRPS